MEKNSGGIVMPDPTKSIYHSSNYAVSEDVVFLDITPRNFTVAGLYEPYSGKPYRRMPQDIAKAVSPGVGGLCLNPAGGRILFRTDSPYLVFRTAYSNTERRPHLTLVTTVGFDVYAVKCDREEYVCTLKPPVDVETGYTAQVGIPSRPGSPLDYVIYMPCYNGLSSLQIGIKSGCKIEKPEFSYKNNLPVVYYGSSITQGATASRPGLAYESIIARDYGYDFINLGFAGNAKGEEAMVEYLAGLECSCLVCDYDHNAPSPEHLEMTHGRLYDTVRKKNPSLPIVFVTRPVYRNPSKGDLLRRETVFATYKRAVDSGDGKVAFVDGCKFFDGLTGTDCTVDGVHPNDIGMYYMAKAIGKAIHSFLM